MVPRSRRLSPSSPRHDEAVREDSLVYELEPGVFYDASCGSFQDANGVDLTLVDQTLAMTPDERVQHLDAWINSVRRLRAEIATHGESGPRHERR